MPNPLETDPKCTYRASVYECIILYNFCFGRLAEFLLDDNEAVATADDLNFHPSPEVATNPPEVAKSLPPSQPSTPPPPLPPSHLQAPLGVSSGTPQPIPRAQSCVRRDTPEESWSGTKGAGEGVHEPGDGEVAGVARRWSKVSEVAADVNRSPANSPGEISYGCSSIHLTAFHIKLDYNDGQKRKVYS